MASVERFSFSGIENNIWAIFDVFGPKSWASRSVLRDPS